MKKFEKELLFSQVEDETTSNGNGSTGENAGEGENDAPEQEPVDEGAEADNNMYDGQDGSSSGQTPNGESYPTSGTVPIDPIEVVGSPTDPAEDDNNMYDGQDGSSSEQTPNGESDPISGTVLIDPVEVVGYPTDPADTPSDAEGPEEEEEDVYYGEDSDINDNSAPDNEYEYGDDGEGDGNTNDDDTQSSTEQSEEETEEVDYIIPPLAQSLTNRPPEAVANGFCLLGCCMWAFYKIFGIRPVFNFVKSIAYAVTNNGFNGIGYNNRFDISILQDICNRYIYELNLQIYLTIRIPKVEQGELYPDITPYIPELRYYLNNNAGVIGIYSTSNHSEHAVLITDIDDNGYYKYIDPVTATEYAGDQPLKDSKFNRFYSIINR